MADAENEPSLTGKAYKDGVLAPFADETTFTKLAMAVQIDAASTLKPLVELIDEFILKNLTRVVTEGPDAFAKGFKFSIQGEFKDAARNVLQSAEDIICSAGAAPQIEAFDDVLTSNRRVRQTAVDLGMVPPKP